MIDLRETLNLFFKENIVISINNICFIRKTWYNNIKGRGNL
jgi:hypothetical protein